MNEEPVEHGAVQRRGMYIEESQMNDEQRQIIDQRGDVSCIVQGCAGSGKSCLALLKAIRLEKMFPRPDYYFITYFQLLSQVLRDEMAVAKSDGGQVMTYREWEKEHRTADYILVDECQDLSPENIKALNAAKRKAIFLYGDDSQQIMDFIKDRRPVALNWIKANLGLPVFKLRKNYRLPKKVAYFAEEISGKKDLHDHCENMGGDKPYVLRVGRRVGDHASLITQVVRNMHFQNVGVLCRSNEDVKSLFEAFNGSGMSVSAKWWIEKPREAWSGNSESYGYGGYRRPRFRDRYETSELRDTTIQIMTCHQAKGLQFEAVFLMSWPDLRDELEVNCYYVAVTRTYHSLFVLYEDQLPPIVHAIPRALYYDSLTAKSTGTTIQI